MSNTKKLVLCSLFVALSAVGANIKILGSIAFDAMPAFLGVSVLGLPYGAAIGFLGHLLTALTSGFPMGLPVHMIIAVGMAITMAAFYFVGKVLGSGILSDVLACAAAVFVNGPATLFVLIPILGRELCFSLMAPLSVVALCNCVLAVAVYRVLRGAKIIAPN